MRRADRRTNATPPPRTAARRSRPRWPSPPAIAGLLVLLVLPALAVHRLASVIDWRGLLAALLLLSGVAFLAYWDDKRRAEGGAWRVAESTLHALGLLGGWPGGFLAQHCLRHKTSKRSFQVVFWLIVLIHQAAALDALGGWRWSREILRVVESL